MDAPSPPSRWWALTALIPLALFVAVGVAADGSDAISRLYFAGDPDRWVVAASGFESLDDARLALGIDLAFAASFAVVGYLLLRAGHLHWAPLRRSPDRGGRWIWGAMPAIAVVAGVLDLLETSGQLIWLDDLDPPRAATLAIACIAWWKWVAYLVALVGLFGLVLGPIAGRGLRSIMLFLSGDRHRERVAPEPVEVMRGRHRVEQHTDGEVLGITASGGGIRSASVMMGAFRGLCDAGTFQRARFLHAVSGGGFASGGWQASSQARREIELFDADHPWFRSVRRRLRYLDNGPGSIAAAVVSAVVRTIIVLGSVVAAAALVGWCAGWLTQSWAVVPGFDNSSGGTAFDDLVAWRLLLPGLVPAVAGLLLVIVGFTTIEARRAVFHRMAAVLASIGGLLLIALVVVPIGIWSGRIAISFFRNGSAETNVMIFGVVSLTGFATALWRMLQAEITRRWSRLGGVFLLVALFLFAGKVADDRANVDRLFSGVWVPVLCLVWLLLTDWLPYHRLTLNGLYRERLAGTFVLGTEEDAEGTLGALHGDLEPEWQDYAYAEGPELVLCGTAQSSRIRHGGLPALGFTFSSTATSLYDGDLGQPGSPYQCGSSWEGYPPRWTVSRSMALAGAAFASKMGRQTFGSTDALLAAVNLRLGVWVPNPNRRTWFDEDHPPPRVHLGYFVKELTGRYDPDDDAFVYVTDGGHRENLGLVEQLRERPDRMIVLDASGDRRGSFGTLRQAIALADVELDAQIDLDWSRIEPREHDVPADCVTTGIARFRDGSGHETRIVYAKAQVCDTMPASLRQFAAADPVFPDYSTGDQFLTTDEFDHLVEVGEHMAARIAIFVS